MLPPIALCLCKLGRMSPLLNSSSGVINTTPTDTWGDGEEMPSASFSDWAHSGPLSGPTSISAFPSIRDLYVVSPQIKTINDIFKKLLLPEPYMQ